MSKSLRQHVFLRTFAALREAGVDSRKARQERKETLSRQVLRISVLFRIVRIIEQHAQFNAALPVLREHWSIPIARVEV